MYPQIPEDMCHVTFALADWQNEDPNLYNSTNIQLAPTKSPRTHLSELPSPAWR